MMAWLKIKRTGNKFFLCLQICLSNDSTVANVVVWGLDGLTLYKRKIHFIFETTAMLKTEQTKCQYLDSTMETRGWIKEITASFSLNCYNRLPAVDASVNETEQQFQVGGRFCLQPNRVVLFLTTLFSALHFRLEINCKGYRTKCTLYTLMSLLKGVISNIIIVE